MFTKKHVDKMAGIGDIKGEGIETEGLSKKLKGTFKKMSKHGVRQVK